MITGLCYTMEALIEFFQMQSQATQPTKHIPPSHNIHVEDKKKYFDETLNEFVGKYLLPLEEPETLPSNEQQDSVMNYSFIPSPLLLYHCRF